MTVPAATDRTILPPAYKKRMHQGMAAWVAMVGCLGGWVWSQANATVKDWNARIPQTTLAVKQVYLTPQITDTSHPDFGTGSAVVHSASAAGGTSAAPMVTGPVVALIMTDLGLADTVTKRAVDDLPPAVALAFSPYGDLPKWIKKAADAKHEPLVLLPMEPQSYPKDDPGPRALLSRASAADNAHNLDVIMKDAAGAYGVMNFMGSTFLMDKGSLSAVYSTLRKDNMIFVENSGGKQTPAGALAGENNLPYLATDSEIDSSATESDISQKLIALEKLARSQGYAVGIAEPYPVAFNVIKSWSADLATRGVTLVPLAQALKARAGAATRSTQDAKPASPAAK